MAENPCWDGYTQVGMKMKNGKEVPNCVPTKKAKRTASVEEQNRKINEAAFALVEKANAEFSGSRRVTKKAALTVVERSLAKNSSEKFSVRKHRALAAVSQYISLAQHNKIVGTLANTDLLPISHPRSSRPHELTLGELLKYKARWITDDPAIKNETVKTLIASALTTHPASPEYEYAVARLSSFPQGQVPQYALLAALGDGNSSAARRARAMRQRRDRKGRFAEMGGGLRALIRRLNGQVQSLTGRAVSQGIEADTFDMELPDGRIARIPAANVEAVKAILPSRQTKDGFGGTPAKYSAKDPVIDEADIQFVDAPEGFREDTDWAPAEADLDYYGDKIDLGKKFTDDAYDVVKIEPNAAARDKFEAVERREGEGQNALAQGAGPKGAIDNEKPVFLINRRGDDRPFAAVQSWADVQDFISQDEPRFENNEMPDPARMGGDDEDETEQARPQAELPEGEIIPGTDKPSRAEMREYRKALKDFRKNGGLVPLDPRKTWRILPDGAIVDNDTGEILRDNKRRVYLDEENRPNIADVADQKAEAPATPEAPATEAPRAANVPNGYYNVDRDEYTPEGAIDGQISPDFTDDPAELAQRFEKEELENALRAGVEGTESRPASGYGALPFEAGDEIVPAEAIYNALKEQGEDADAILDDIYSQKVPQEVVDAEGVDIPEAPRQEVQDREVPPLIDGLTDEEKRDFIDNGNYQKYLPKNKEDFDVPEGYAALMNEPFDDPGAIPFDAPEGFSANPVDIALGYDQEGLKQELRRALEPGNSLPGYGILAQEDENGEEFQAYIPGEAIRDALQLQGVNTNELIDEIYAEGNAGQDENQPTADEIADALEGENVQEEATAPTPEEEAPAEAEEQAPQDEAGPEAPATDAGEPAAGRELTPEEQQEAALAVGEPQRLEVRAADLQPGDIAVRDDEYFVIEEVNAPDVATADQGNKKVNRVAVKGYYPGHQTQDRNWFANGKIEIVRGVAAPAKGDAPALNKPELADYGKLKKFEDGWGLADPAAQAKYDADLAAHKAAVKAASAGFVDPTKTAKLEEFVENAAGADPMPAADGPVIAKLPAGELQAGDITTKDHFRITDIRMGEDGKVIITGHYPGYGLQEKKWWPNTNIEVIRGIPEDQAPQLGEGELHRPAGRGPKGGWFPDENTEANAAHQEKLAEAKARWNAPENLPVVAASDLKAENKLVENPDVPPKAPFLPGFPPFQGKFAEWAREAAGNWQAFKDKLKGQEFVVFDFETTGVNVEDGNEPWQVAGVRIKDGEVVDRINIFMNPGRPIAETWAGKNAKDPDGNPLTDDFFADKPSQEEAIKQFIDWAGENPLVIGQNARFDDEVIRRKAAEFGLDWNVGGVADTMAMGAEFQKDDASAPKRKRLGDLAKWLGINQENWHAADDDALVTAGIFNAMIDKGIADGFGASALDVDARQAEVDQRMADLQPQIDKFNQDANDWLARKALADAMANRPVPTDVEQLNKAKPAAIPEGPYDMGAVGNPDPAPAPRADLVDVSINSAFPEGKMRIAEAGWADDMDNVEQIFRGGIKANDLRPGDFVKAKKDSDEFYQVISIRGGEEFGVEEFKRRIVLQNAEGDRRVVLWNQNAFLDEVRRPKDRAALAGEPAPEPQRTPEELNMQAVTVAAGNAVLEINPDGDDFVVRGRLLDNDGNEIYSFEGRYVTPEGAEAEGKALLRRAAADYAAQQRRNSNTEAREDKSVAVGNEPANVDQIPAVEFVEDLAIGEGQVEVTPRVEGDAVVFRSDAKVVEEGEVLGQIVEDRPSQKEAFAAGRDNVDAIADALADQIKAQRDELLLRTEGRGRRNLPPIPEKYRRQVYIRLLAGLYADSNGNPLAIGDKVIHENPEKAAKYGEGVVVGKVQGKIGGLQRKGVVYVDYVRVQYPDGTIRKYASRFQRHVDADVAKQRFDAEPRINWMNKEEMDMALAERRKKPRKGGNEAVDNADAEVEEVVQDVKNVADGVVPSPQEGQPVAKPSFVHDINWFKENVQPQALLAGEVKVGDFLPTRGDKNIGRVIAIEDLDRAVRIKVEYPNGRQWDYNPIAKGFELPNVYRLDGAERPESPETPEAPAAQAPESPESPQAPEAPAAEAPAVEEAAPEAPRAGDPFVDLDDKQAIIDKLKELRAKLPNFRNNRADKGARWAAREIDRLVELLDNVPIDRIGAPYVREALRWARRIEDPKYKAVSPEAELQKLEENIVAKREELKQKRRQQAEENLRQPIDDAIIPTNAENLKREEVANVLQEFANRLPDNQLEDADRELYRARLQIEGVIGRLGQVGDNDFDRINKEYLENAERYIRRGSLDEAARNEIADKLQKLAEVVNERALADRAIRHAKYIERLNQPLDENVFPNADNLNRENVAAAVDAVLALLPNVDERDAEDDLYRAADALRDYRRDLERNDPDGIGRWSPNRAIENLRRANDPRQNEIAQKLEDMLNLVDENKQKFRDQRLAAYKKRLAQPFDENLVIGNPEDFNKDNLVKIFEALQEKLPQANEIDAERQVRRAGEYAANGLERAKRLADGDDNALKNFDDTAFRKIIDKVRANGGDDEKFIADFAEKGLELLVEKKNLLKGEAREKFLARRNADLPNDILPAEGRESKDDFVKFADEIIDRLPKDEDEEADIKPIRALDALREFKDAVAQAPDPLIAGQDKLRKAIDNLKSANDEKYQEFAEQLQEMQDFMARRVIERPIRPFAGINLEEVDPIDLAEQRVAAGENKFQAGQKVRDLFADDKLFDDSPFLRPFKENIQQFFNGQANPMAALDLRERQAVAQLVGEKLKDPRKDPDLAGELVDLALALHEERDFYQPQRSELGPVGLRLLGFSPDKFFAAARSIRNGDLVIDGQDTGFTVKQVGTGINSSHNFFVTDKATGQRFIFKKEKDAQSAAAEAEAARIIAGLKIGGRVFTELHPDDPTVMVQTFAGDTLRLVGAPKDFADVRGDANNANVASKRAALVDLVRMGILDAVINNTDRHYGNFKFAEADVAGVGNNGHEDAYIIPFDHGYAAALNENKSGNMIRARDFALRIEDHGRHGGQIVQKAAEGMGAAAYKKLVDMSVQQLIQYLERLEPGQMREPQKKRILDRLKEIEAITEAEWRILTGGR